jgi:Zn-dependent protease with chaperone function
MSELEFARCDCAHCGNHLEFPLELADTPVDCPHCGENTLLLVEAQPAPGVCQTTEQPDVGWTVARIQEAFVGRIRRPWTSPSYVAALWVVSGLMVLLPVVYVGMIGATGYGVYWWADHGRFLFHAPTGGVYGLLIRGTLYVAPLIAGVITVVFMVKPLLARPGRRAQPLAINPVAEPVIYTLVQEVARQVGSPMPARIDLDCQLNASAGFRRGLASIFGGDLVLTIGLPLVAGLSALELTGVIAHELGHFRQGLAMRLTTVVRAINGWFARVIYQRDAWDEALAEWGNESESLAASLIVICSAFAVWLSRRLLTLLLLVGHALSSILLRQMEIDADRCEYRLAGSDAFESAIRRLNVLSKVAADLYREMGVSWTHNHQLPDNLPAVLALRERQQDPAVRERVENTLGLRRAQWYESHPSDAERIRRARREAAPGVAKLQGPATALFSCFDVPARQVTLLHYTDDLNLPVVPAALVATNS